jgi:hypothetical protein
MCCRGVLSRCVVEVCCRGAIIEIFQVVQYFKVKTVQNEKEEIVIGGGARGISNFYKLVPAPVLFVFLVLWHTEASFWHSDISSLNLGCHCI